MPKNEEKLTEEVKSMHIANCVACSLADAMKVCAVCRFNIGLEARAKKLAELKKSAENGK